MKPERGPFATFDRLLRTETGQTLDWRRKVNAEAALQPIVRAHGLGDLDRLAQLVERGDRPQVIGECVEALLNQETSFFRDAAVFDLLRRSVLPFLIGRRSDRRRLRLWSAGCSTGQEAYSLALLSHAMPDLATWSLEILGTDVSARAVERARAGRYSQFEIQRGLPVRDMIAHFDKEGSEWVARAGLRSLVRFRQAKLPARRGLMPQQDLILCRNLLIYLDGEARSQLLDCLADWLAPDGVLVLGASETNFGHSRRLIPSMAFRGCYRLEGAED